MITLSRKPVHQMLQSPSLLNCITLYVDITQNLLYSVPQFNVLIDTKSFINQIQYAVYPLIFSSGHGDKPRQLLLQYLVKFVDGETWSVFCIVLW